MSSQGVTFTVISTPKQRRAAKKTPEERLALAETKVRELATKIKRLTTLMKRHERSARALRRVVERRAAEPPPEPVHEPATLFQALEEQTRETAEADEAALLARLQREAEAFATTLGVVRPTVRWAGTPGACARVVRAHVHTHPVGYAPGWRRIKGELVHLKRRRWVHHRGDICVSRSYVDHLMRRHPVTEPARLMAHEVSHLSRSHKRRGYGNAHGRGFYENLSRLLGTSHEEARRHDHHQDDPTFTTPGG